MNGSCTTCGMTGTTGGSVEFFDQYALLSQQENKQKADKNFCNTCVGGKNENSGNPFDGANFANSLACTDGDSANPAARQCSHGGRENCR